MATGQAEAFGTFHMDLGTTPTQMPSVLSGRESVLIVNNSVNTIYYAATLAKCTNADGGIIPPGAAYAFPFPPKVPIWLVSTAASTDVIVTEYS